MNTSTQRLLHLIALASMPEPQPRRLVLGAEQAAAPEPEPRKLSRRERGLKPKKRLLSERKERRRKRKQRKSR